MSSFPTTGYSYTLGTSNGTPNRSDTVNAFAPVLEPPIKLQPQQVYQPAAVFEPTPIIHGRQHVEPRPDLKLRPFVDPRPTYHPSPRYVPGVTWHTPDKLLPGKTYQERDTFQPRRVEHLQPRKQLQLEDTHCPMDTQTTIVPSPFVAPWECLPQPSAPANNGARHQVKTSTDCSDVSRTGMLVDLFL